jgi:small subunit ribosomal protein S18
MDTNNQPREPRAERPERPERPEREEHAAGGLRPRKRRKVCAFCADKIDFIDYKDVPRLRRHMSERGKILPCRMTGACARHQRQLTVAIKRARQIALLPYVAE